MNDHNEERRKGAAQQISRRDFLRGGIFSGATAIAMLIMKRQGIPSQTAGQAGGPRWEITVDGQIVEDGVLDPDGHSEIYIPVRNGMAHIVLDEGRIYVHEDNSICPKKICQLMGSIRHSGETIVCLPNKMVIRIL
jgi:hypothetical protein